ncbi:hypothetical protein LOC68_19750 [Blastopirellula sp. JC732]|uniref:Uncharacterized protein n=1 Tax=Blastopirellula sediminis TaxID=2894196 RepID=A0A9X1MQR0_9BACT|nr:hypothetical protein [Blastopirellula sediminis]MCC9606066.1 hypothetical protein [Blastopirellula sediminis]MCC9630635.1 hypothetical protein [Blastopirellula sediminis]
MSRFWIALVCASTLTLTAPVRGEEPGEGLIDGLIAQIRRLEARLERVEAQTDKNNAEIERAQSQAIPPKVMAELLEGMAKLNMRIDQNSAAIERTQSQTVPPKVMEDLREGLQRIHGRVEKNSAAIDRAAASELPPKFLPELLERLTKINERVERNSAAIERANASELPPKFVPELLERLERLDIRVDKNSAAIDRAEKTPAKPLVIAEAKQPKVVKAKKQEESLSLDWKPKEPLDFAGQWLMTLPLGAEHQIVIKETGDDQFKLVRPKLNMAGIYKASGGKLMITKPDDKRLTGFVWTAINRNTLVLTGEPPVERTGSSYLGATLTRQIPSPGESQ